MGDSIRESLEAAASALEVPEAIEPANEPVAVEVPEVAANEPPALEAKESKPDRPRDESGKFTKAPKDSTEKKAAALGTEANGVETPTSVKGAKALEQTVVPGTPPPATDSSVQPTLKYKAPQSWKPAAREDWTKVPESIQGEVDRRERETAKALQDAAEARRGYDAFRQTIAPYEAMMRREGAQSPFHAIGSLLQSVEVLQNAPRPMAAQVVARIITQYGVPIEELAKALDGTQPANQPMAGGYPQQVPNIDRLVEQKLQAMQQQAMMHRNQTELQEFESNPPEFYSDVREDMADVLELAARRGKRLSLMDAYNQAVRMHPEISEVMSKRDATKAAVSANASTQRAKVAASSVKSSPASTVKNGGQPKSIRDYLEAADEAMR